MTIAAFQNACLHPREAAERLFFVSTTSSAADESFVVDVGMSGPEFFDSRFAAGKTPWDFGGVPSSLKLFLEKHHGPGRVLIPGCGSGYEIEAFASTHWEVMGVDFSTVAVARARQLLGPLGDQVHQGDFFAYPLRQGWFDIIYERTFLCTLTPEFRFDMLDGLPS